MNKQVAQFLNREYRRLWITVPAILLLVSLVLFSAKIFDPVIHNDYGYPINVGSFIVAVLIYMAVQWVIVGLGWVLFEHEPSWPEERGAWWWSGLVMLLFCCVAMVPSFYAVLSFGVQLPFAGWQHLTPRPGIGIYAAAWALDGNLFLVYAGTPACKFLYRAHQRLVASLEAAAK